MNALSLGTLWPGALLLGLLLLLLFHKPLFWLLRLLMRSAAALALLFGWTASGLLPALTLGVNAFNALTLGLLGLPGFGLLMLLRTLSH